MVTFQRPFWSPVAGFDSATPHLYSQSDIFRAHADSDSSHQNPKVHGLDFSQFCPFEVVTDQFKPLGIQFEGAIALQPSNPIFWTHKRNIVLMPTAGRQSVQIRFKSPINQLCISVIGVREVKMVATGSNRPPLIQRSPQPSRTFRQPTDLLDPLNPYHLELNGELVADVSLESSHPFVISAILFGLIQTP